MEAAILASFLGGFPSRYALVHDFPNAIEDVLEKWKAGFLDDDDCVGLLVESFCELNDFVLGRSSWSRGELSDKERARIVNVLCSLLEDGIICGRLLEGPVSVGTFLTCLDDVKEVWVVGYIFRGMHLLGQDDVGLKDAMVVYFDGMGLAQLREISVGFVLDNCVSVLRDECMREVVILHAVVKFLQCPVLQRRLEGIGVLVDVDIPGHWLVDNDIFDIVFCKYSVHGEIVKRMVPLLCKLVGENLLSTEQLEVLWGISPETVYVLIAYFVGRVNHEWVLNKIASAEYKNHGIMLKMVQDIGMETGLGADLVFKAALLLWDMGDGMGLALLVCRQSDVEMDGVSLLELILDKCVQSLGDTDNFFSHLVLAQLWLEIPKLHEMLEDLEDKWIEALGCRFRSIFASRDHLRISLMLYSIDNVLELGAEMVLHSSNQRVFLERIWDTFQGYLVEDINLSNVYFEWLTDVISTKTAGIDAAQHLIETKIYPFLNKHQLNEVFVDSISCFLFIQLAFTTLNIERFENLMETQIEDDSYFQYLIPKCDPAELDGIQYLWRAAIHSAEEAVAKAAIESLQSLYDPALDAGADRVSSEYVATCIQMLTEQLVEQEFSERKVLRCLGFIQALLNEADVGGTRGVRPHGARQRGHIHNLVVIQNDEEERVIDLMMYSNATVWDIRCAIASRFGTLGRHLASRIILRRPSRENALLSKAENAETLASLDFSGDETLTFEFIDSETMQQEPKVRLLDIHGEELNIRAIKAVDAIFDEWASIFAADSGETELLMSVDDFERLFLSCTRATNARAVERRIGAVFNQYATVLDETGSCMYLSRQDLRRFYTKAAIERPRSVWKDFFAHGFNNKIQREGDQRPNRITSELRLSIVNTSSQESTPDIGWRAILSSHDSLYESLFRLLAMKKTSERVADFTWSILLRLPTSPQLLSQIQQGNWNSVFVSNANSSRIVQYSMHIIVSFMEQDESDKLLLERANVARNELSEHMQRARRASYEPPSRRLSLDGNKWTRRFLSDGGLERIIELLGIDVQLAGALDILELSLKCCKLVFSLTKFGSHILLELPVNRRELLIGRVTQVLNRFLGLEIKSITTAEYALFVWEFYFSWMHQHMPDQLCFDQMLDLMCTTTTAPLSDKEQVYSRKLWEDLFVEAVTRTSAKIPAMQERFLDMLVRLVSQRKIEPWLIRLLVNLLGDGSSVYTTIDESGRLVDDSLVQSVSRDISCGEMRYVSILQAVVAKQPKRFLNSAGFSVKELVVQISHKLLSMDCEYRVDMMNLLDTLCQVQKSVLSTLTEIVIIPLLRSQTSVGWESTSPKNIRVGLSNLGNTCYVNSVLQQFVAIPALVELVLNAPPSNIISELQKTFAYLLKSRRKVYCPETLIQALGIDRMEQQDCEEFLNKILDMLEETKQKELWSKTFGGTLETRSVCASCSAETTRVEPMGTHIAVDVQGFPDLQTSLDEGLFRQENVEDYICDNCKATGTLEQKKSWGGDLPGTLIFHLKRFRFDLQRRVKQKISSRFKFQESFLGKKLVGILCHQGSAESGHYYSYLQKNQQWIEMNDENVRPVGGFPLECYDSAYMLFYADEETQEQEKQLPQSLHMMVDSDNVKLVGSTIVGNPVFWKVCKTCLTGVVGTLESRRKSVGTARLSLQPAWWPEPPPPKRRNRSVSTSSPVPGDEDSEEPPSPTAAEEVTVTPTSRKENLLAMTLIQFFCFKSSCSVEPEIVQSICKVIARLCNQPHDMELLIEIIGFVYSISVSANPENINGEFLFLFLSLVYDQGEKDINRLDILRRSLLRDDAFFNMVLIKFSPGEKHLVRVTITLLQCCLHDELPKMNENERTITTQLLDSQEDFLHSIVRELVHAIPSAPVRDEFVERLTSISAKSVISALHHIATTTTCIQERTNTSAMLEKLLARDDENTRLEAILSQQNNTTLSILAEILPVLDKQEKMSTSLIVLDSPRALMFIAMNKTVNTRQVRLWFIETGEETFQLPPLGRAFKVKVPGNSSRLLYYGEKHPNQTNSCWNAQWEVIFSHPDEEQENIPDRGNKQQNHQGVKIERIKGMGFADTRAIQRALEFAKGDENTAVEFLLSSDSI